MKDRKKATGRAADNVFDMAHQVIRNYQDDYGFTEVIDWLKDNHFRCTGVIPAGSTPNVLKLGGANLDFNLVVTPGTIAKCMSSPTERYHGHSLDRDIFKQLPHELRNPVMLLKGSKPNTLVAVIDLRDKESCPIVVSVALNRVHRHHLTNQVTSVYGKRDFYTYISHQIKKGNLIAVNKNKANKMFQSIGLQLPGEETLISYDNSIAYTLNNVKSFYGKNLENADFISLKKNYSDEITNTINKLNDLVCEYEEIVEMIQFFEYAGDEIRNSVLWHQFQQDKEYLSDNELVSRLKDVVSEARKATEEQRPPSQYFMEENVNHEGPKERLGCNATRLER